MPDLDMSPYAAFVWASWGISALTLAALAVRALVAARRWKRELDALEGDARSSSPKGGSALENPRSGSPKGGSAPK